MAKGTSKNKFGNFSKNLLSILGISIVALMFAIIWYWETYGRIKFLYQNVVELKQDVNIGTIITADMTTSANLEQSTLMKDPIVNKNDIVGKAAKHYIPADTPLSSHYFDNSSLVPSADTFIFKIPTDWILSVPDSIRRGDKALICEVKGAGLPKNFGTQPSADTVNTYTPEQLAQINSQLGQSLVTTTVAYVKDGNNKEIVDVGKDDRLDGSAKIGGVEVLINAKQLADLQASFNNGNKFIILYGEQK